MTDDPAPPTLLGTAPSRDDPISDLVDDALARRKFVLALTSQVQAATDRGAVIALTGPWGIGKSSVLELLASELKNGSSPPAVLRFNPWLFSGTDELVTSFFSELGAQLKEDYVDLQDVGDKLRRFGTLIAPLKYLPAVGKAFEASTDIASAVGDALAKQPSLHKTRQDLVTLLEKKRARVVVMVDDIDRLEDDEVAQIMKLVRLVGDFPRVVYVLAYDADRVGRVLAGDSGGDGSAFLEKIVQLSHPVPEIGQSQLRELAEKQVETVLLAGGLADDDPRGVGLALDVVVPLMDTVRDVRRFGSALPLALHMSVDETALPDVLALEGLRLFAPSMYDGLQAVMEAVDGEDDETAALEPLLGELLDAFDHSTQRHLRRFVKQVFPPLEPVLKGGEVDTRKLENARAAGRVAAPAGFFIYRQKFVPSTEVSKATIDAIVEALGDGDTVASLLAALDDGQFERVLVRLPHVLGDSLGVDAVTTGTLALLMRAEPLRTATGYLKLAGPLRPVVDTLFGGLDDDTQRCETTLAITGRCPDVLLHYFLVTTLTRSSAEHSLTRQCKDEKVYPPLRDRIVALDQDARRKQPALAYMLQWVLRRNDGTVLEWLGDEETLIQYWATLGPSTRMAADVQALLADDPERLTALQARLEADGGQRAKQALGAMRKRGAAGG